MQDRRHDKILNCKMQEPEKNLIALLFDRQFQRRTLTGRRRSDVKIIPDNKSRSVGRSPAIRHNLLRWRTLTNCVNLAHKLRCILASLLSFAHTNRIDKTGS